MRSLSGTLLAAQKAASGIPYVRTVAANNLRGARHLQFVSDYIDGSADVEHDAAGDATYLHRARVNASNAEYQRNASASWTIMSSDATVSRVAIAARGARVTIAYNRTNDIYVRESTDSGGTFGAETLAIEAGAVPLALAIVYQSSGGDLLLLYERSNAVRRVRRTSGTWGSSAAWTLSAATINGIDVVQYADFLVLVSGTETTTLRPTVWSCELGDGVFIASDTWQTQRIMVQAETDEAVTFRRPYLAYLVDSDLSLRATYVEQFTGTGAYTRTFLTARTAVLSTPVGHWEWMDPVPLNNTASNGYVITSGKTPDKVFLSRPGEVLAAPTAAVTLDMSADLVEATVEEKDGLRRTAELVFDNAAGTYLGPPAPIALHHDVSVGLGYDAEHSKLAGLSITGWEYLRDGGKARFVLRLAGAAYWMALSRARTTIGLASVKPTDITRGAAFRAGMQYAALGSSTRSSSFAISWVVHPHQNAYEAANAMLELLADVLLSQSGSDGLFRVLIHEPKASETADYTFGTDHAIYRSRTAGDEQTSFAEIMAEGALGQAFDFTAMAFDKPLQDRRRDPHATTEANADAYADARLRKGVLAKDLGELVVPPNVGLEVADVVSYTDDLASASSIVARVRSIQTKFRRAAPGRTPVYEQTILLGGV